MTHRTTYASILFAAVLVLALGTLLVRGQTLATPLRVASTPDWSILPQIAVDTRGNINLLWMEQPQAPGSGPIRRLLFSRSVDGGLTFTAPIDVAAGVSNPYILNMVVDKQDAVNIIYTKLIYGAGDADDGDIYFTRSTDGVNFSSPINLSMRLGYCDTGWMTVDVTGNISVVWRYRYGSTSDLYFARSADHGLSFSPAINLTNNGTNYLSNTPFMAVDGLGRIHLTWSHGPRSQETYQVMYALSTDGATFSTPVAVSSAGASALLERYPQRGVFPLDVDAHGNVSIVWLGCSQAPCADWDHGVDVYFSRSTDGVAFSTPVNVSMNAQQAKYPNLSVDNQGTIYVAWIRRPRGPGPIDFDVLLSRSTDDGGSFSDPLNLSTDTGLTSVSGEPGGARIAVDDFGTVNVTWYDDWLNGFGSDIFLRRSTDRGATFSPALNVSNQYGWSAVEAIALDARGEIYIAWQDTYPTLSNPDIFFTRLTYNTSPVAEGETYELDEDQTLTVNAPGVLANDGDPNGEPLTAVLVSGPAHGAFTLNPDGSLSYAPDANCFGPDSCTYKVSDGSMASGPVTVEFTVFPVNDVPVAGTQQATTDEDVPATIPLAGTDADGDALTFAVAEGPAHGALSWADGVLTYTPAPDFSGTDTFTVVADDGHGGVSPPATVAVTVAPVNDPPLATPQTVSMMEDQVVAIALAGSDPDGDPLTFRVIEGPAQGTIGGSGASITYIPNPDFHGTDAFTVVADDGHGGVSVPVVVTVTVSPVNDQPVLQPLTLSATSIAEGSTVTLSGAFVDPDVGDPHAVAIAWGDGTSETLSLAAGTGAFTATHRYVDDDPAGTPADQYAIAVTVRDADGLEANGTATLTVANVAPVITSVAGPTAPMPVSSPANLTVQFADPAPETFAARFAWGDGTESLVTGTATSASATHLYASPGVHVVAIQVTDDDTGTVATTYQYLVVYDPTGSFVTGGGFIDSPAGAYAANPTLAGRAHFGFVSRYQKGATVPTGKTEFRFTSANLDFASTAFEWLVIAGMKAKFRGVGTINGTGDYAFMITAFDGNAPGQTDVDRFRIQIWDRVSGAKVYDNQTGDDEQGDARMALAGGAIEIHQVK